MNQDKWDARWMDTANLFADWSKDRSTKVGCVIVGAAGQILSSGFNGFPRGVSDDVDARHARPAKYKWTEHAERNALYNAARSGVAVQGATMYLPWFPCSDCARGIIQCGIGCLVATYPDFHHPTFGGDFLTSEVMLRESAVEIRWFQPGEE